MCCCVTIQRDVIRFKIGIRLMFMLWVGHHQEEPNVYYIQLLNSSKPGQPKVVNRHQLFDLKRSVPPSTVSLDADGFSSILSFLDRKHHIFSSPNVGDHSDNLSHHYSTHSKHKTATTCV